MCDSVDKARPLDPARTSVARHRYLIVVIPGREVAFASEIVITIYIKAPIRGRSKLGDFLKLSTPLPFLSPMISKSPASVPVTSHKISWVSGSSDVKVRTEPVPFSA